MIRFLAYAAVALGLFLAGCAEPPRLAPVYQFEPPEKRLSYLDDVKPVLVKRCVVCHSCYNSPCQLKLSSWEGLDRGASKEKIYNASRLRTMEPSRLFIDAQSTPEWRDKGFFSVKQEGVSTAYDESIMFLLLDHKRNYPDLLRAGKTSEKFEAEADDLTCAENRSELDTYLKKHPNRGMPFGFPPLSQKDFNTVTGWLSQGAEGPRPEELAALKAVPAEDRDLVEKWEKFLNNPYPKYRMTARYVYEHLFLAHLSLNTGSKAFYELVRSRTGPGEEIDVIATVRPYDDPGTCQFYYRLRRIHATIVFKTHMVFPFDERQYRRINKLFIEPDWPQKPFETCYSGRMSANPFESFEQIPVRSRYQWLLDNARYTVMTFIRGPVCKGQVALNVINDQFWLLFLDPDYDLSVRYPYFLKQHFASLQMPGEEGSNYRLYKALFFWKKYKRWAFDYYKSRQDFYSFHYPEGLGPEAIWQGNKEGDRPDDQPILTIFRHFDSASVHRGPLGKLPKTAWVVDYPLLERIYYSLVAGFDIYGTAGHQLATRRYMDALRIEGESYFLDFLPEEVRRPIMEEQWYQGAMEDDLDYYPSSMPAKFAYRGGDPKREFLEEVIINNIAKSVDDIEFDENYLPAGATYPELPEKYVDYEDFIQGFIASAAPDLSFFKYVRDHNANVGWVRITDIPGEEDSVVSMVVDRWHDNVKYISNEEIWLNPEKDQADFIRGFVGSYPNYFFVVSVNDLPDFFKTLRDYDGTTSSASSLSKYGVNRAQDDFWEVFDWFQEKFLKSDPLEAGIIDLNRYYNLAIK